MIVILKKRILFRILAVVVLLCIGTGLFFYLSYPQKYASLVYQEAEAQGLDPKLLFSIMRTESGFDPDASSHKHAIGLMQITSTTGAWIADQMGIDSYDLADPQTNIRFSCWYLRYLQELFHGYTQTVLAAYNAGTGNVQKWLANPAYSQDGQTLQHIPFGETKRYVKKVNRTYRIYQIIYR